jgi:hypothetical protein
MRSGGFVRTGFTRPEIADYRSNGFLSFPDVLTVDELAHWREVVDAAMAARPPSAVRTQQREGVHLADASAPGLHAVGQLVEDRRLGHLVTELEGVDAVRVNWTRRWSRSRTALPGVPHRHSLVGLLLTPRVHHLGGYFVPGSHRLGSLLPGDLGPELGLCTPPIPRRQPGRRRAPFPLAAARSTTATTPPAPART